MSRSVIRLAEGFDLRATRLGRFVERFGYGSIDALTREAVHNPEPFWEAVLADIGLTWITPYRQVFGAPAGSQARGWFLDGQLNLTMDAVDKWARREPNRPAIIWIESDGARHSLTWHALRREVVRVARGLTRLGIGQGERVGIHLPMFPEALVAMLAAARIGAVAVPFNSRRDFDAAQQQVGEHALNALLCPDGWLLDESRVESIRQLAGRGPAFKAVIVVERTPSAGLALDASRANGCGSIATVSYAAFADQASTAELLVGVDPGAPLIQSTLPPELGDSTLRIQTHAGFAIQACQHLTMALDVTAGDGLMWLGDFPDTDGPWLMLGALVLGATLILTEQPEAEVSAEQVWDLVSTDTVTHVFLSADMARRLQDQIFDPASQWDCARLRIFGTLGPDWHPAIWNWLFEIVGNGHRPLVPVAGPGAQGFGGAVLASPAGLPMKCGAYWGVLPGLEADVVDAQGRSLRGLIGDVVLRRPWPWMAREQGESLGPNPSAGRGHRGQWLHGSQATIDGDGFWCDHGASVLHRAQSRAMA